MGVRFIKGGSFFLVLVVAVAVAAVVFASGCVQGPETVCGNGICEQGESEGDCPGDCVDVSFYWKSINGNLPSKDNQVRDNVADNLALTADNRYLVLGLLEHGVWKADLSKIDLGS